MKGILRSILQIVVAALLGTVSCLVSAIPAKGQFQGCELIQQVTLEECQALETFFMETGGPTWFRARGWLRSNQPCDWYGITCASGAWPRKVTRIELPGNNLSGTLPGEVSLLTELRHLVIDNRGAGIRYARLNGNLPAVLGQLTHLEVLRLDDNEFDGTIPPEFGKLSSLRSLGLSQNELTGPVPAALGNLVNLTTLDLGDNILAGAIPDSLELLQKLVFLYLSDNLLDGPLPEAVGRLQNLEAIDLSNNNLEGPLPDVLMTLPRLRWLSVTDNNLEGALPLDLATFGAGLSTCRMQRNNLCLPSDPPYSALGSKPVCGLLPADSCQICKGPACTSLEELYHSAGGPDWVQADGWLTTPSPCQWFGAHCDSTDRLTRLETPSNGLSGTLAPALGQITSLTEVDLSGNALSGALPSELAQLASLTRLDLSANDFSGHVPLDVAILGAGMASCNLTGSVGLCIPDDSEYQAIGRMSICGLPLTTPCSPSSIVAFKALEAKALYDGVALLWETTQAPLANMFEVQLLQAHGEFVPVASIASGGTRYRHIITDLGPGTHTFRVRQTTPQNADAYSASVSVSLVPEGLTIGEPFPVPFRTSATVTFSSGTQQSVRVDLFDAAGRLVRTLYRRVPPAHMPVPISIDGNDLSSGTYFLRFFAGGRVHGTRTVVRIR